MEERYPYIRLVINVARLLAGLVAAVILLGGLMAACRAGGFFLGVGQLLVAVLIAGGAYLSAMVCADSMRVLLDIEENTRRLSERMRTTETPPPSV
jgi:hypothetical protein